VAQSLQLEWGWGLLFTGGALLVVAAAWPGSDEDTKAPATLTCPDCAEEVKAEARVCRFCGRRLEPPALPDDAPKLDEPLRLFEEAQDLGHVHLLIDTTDSPEARKRLVTRLAPYFPGKTPTEIERDLILPYVIPQRISREAAAAVQRKWGEAGIRIQVVSVGILDSGAEVRGAS
jgi:hypothetical protein